MAFSIGTRKQKGKWICHAVASGTKLKNFIGKTQDEAYEIGLKYLNENYFNLSTNEVNARVAILRKAQEK